MSLAYIAPVSSRRECCTKTYLDVVRLVPPSRSPGPGDVHDVLLLTSLPSECQWTGWQEITPGRGSEAGMTRDERHESSYADFITSARADEFPSTYG
jgi:hypothetical protein